MTDKDPLEEMEELEAEIKAANDEKTIMKTHLHNAGSKIFWEIWSEGSDVLIRSGAVDSEGETTTHSYDSHALAVFEMYQLILQKRQEGYRTPNAVSMEDFMKYETVPLESLDEDLYSEVHDDEGSVIFIDGDLALEKLDLDAISDSDNNIDGIIVNGNLSVDGGIENAEGDYGPFLVVTGRTLADYVMGGGSEIYLEKESFIRTFTVGHYNHGILSLKGFSLFFLNSDHQSSASLNDVEGLSVHIFDVDDEDEEFPDFYNEQVSEDEDEDDVDIDDINRLIIDEDERVKLLQKLLKYFKAD